MSRINFVTSSDEHLSDLAPGFRKDDYRADVLRMIEWQGDFAKKSNSNAVLRGGDFFHVKAANKTTMRTMAMAARLHRNYSCPTYSLAGNHDMSNNDPQSIPGQPLGVMFGSNVFRKMEDEIFESGSLKVRVVGVEYTTDLDVDGLSEIVKKKDENFTIAFIHALASMAPTEKIQSFFNERIFDYRDLVFNGCPDLYVFGHYHKDQGIVEHLGVKFVNLGSISRGSLTFENLDRKPKSALIEISPNGINAEEIVIPHPDSSEIFDLEKKKQIDVQKKDLSDFISSLRASSSLSSDTSLDSRKSELSSFPDDLRKLCLETLEAAESGLLDQ